MSNPIQDEAIESFIAFIQSLDSTTLKPSTTETWGPREVLIHLVWWHEQYVKLARAASHGKTCDLPEGTLKQMNARCVTANIKVPIPKLIARWNRANRQLTALTSSPGGSRISISLGRNTRKWPLQVLLRLSAGHIQRHENKLRKKLRRVH